MATTLPSGNTQALPGISLSPPRQTGQNVYSLHAEQPPSPLSRCAFRLRLSGHFLLLVTKKKALYTVYVEIYSICFYKATNFAVFENKKKKSTVLWTRAVSGDNIVRLCRFPRGPRDLIFSARTHAHSVTKSGSREDYLL